MTTNHVFLYINNIENSWNTKFLTTLPKITSEGGLKMKKLAVLISFLLIVVGSAASTAAAGFPVGIYNVSWTDGPAIIKITDNSSAPETLAVAYYWGVNGNGICTQAKVDNDGSTLGFELRGNDGEMTVILRVSEDNMLIGEKYSFAPLQRLAE